MFRVIANFKDGKRFELGYTFATEWAANIYARDCIDNELVANSLVYDKGTGEVLATYER